MYFLYTGGIKAYVNCCIICHTMVRSSVAVMRNLYTGTGFWCNKAEDEFVINHNCAMGLSAMINVVLFKQPLSYVLEHFRWD